MENSGTGDMINRRRHSSAENIKVQKTVNVRLSMQDSQFLRYDEIQVFKVKHSVIHKIDHGVSKPDTSMNSEGEKFTSEKNDETDSRSLRVSDSLCVEEEMAIRQRKLYMSGDKKSREFLGKGEEIPFDYVPNIAMIGSGGGVRAMTAMSSVFCTLHDLNLLQYILYAAGLSGSAWYLTTLYSHKDWPQVHPRFIHEEIKKKVLGDLFNTLKEILKVPGTWLSNLILQYKPMNITQLFGLSLSSNLMPDRFTTRWSSQRDKLKDGKVPFPLLACIHAKSDTPAKEYHEWVEISPFEVAIPKYGIGMDIALFGSVFDRGNLIQRLEELPLYYINGIIGSAFTIINDELALLQKDGKRDSNDEITEADGAQSTDDDEDCLNEDKVTIDNPDITEDGENFETDTNGNKRIEVDAVCAISVREQGFVDEQQFKRIQNECPGWLKDFMSETISTYARQTSYEENDFEIDGLMDDALGYVKCLLKNTFLESRDFRAARLHNPMRNMSFDGSSSHLEDKVEGIFSRIFERADRNQPLCFVDAGFAFNSPYPLVLRSQRSVDLILSFDFTDRGSINGDPFKEVRLAKKWADLHKVKFPPVPEFESRQGVKELYILEDEQDPLCPVIMHFVLINRDFKLYSSPGNLRDTVEEVSFANFDLFKDSSCPYNSQNFKFTDLQFQRLSELVRFNIIKNEEKIKEQIQKASERRANIMRK